MMLPHLGKQCMSQMHYFLQNLLSCYYKKLLVSLDTTRERYAFIHPASGMSSSRKLSFRCKEFSETQSVALVILGNPICRANPIRSGLGLRTNARTTFRCMGFSETHIHTFRIPIRYRGVYPPCRGSLAS